MAWVEVQTKVANPARSKTNMTAKQIKYFGSKRQKAALRAKRSRAAAASHRPRTKPTSNPSRTKKRVVAKAKSAKKRVVAKASAKSRKNPTPMIISWAAGNPAQRRKKSMAQKKRKVAKAKQNTAGRRTTKVMKAAPRKRAKNPAGLGRPMDWVTGGAGVLVGVVGARALPQVVLGASNTGIPGYVANAVSALGLGWVTHMVFPRNPLLAASVIAGGFAGTIARVISDQTPFGAQLSLTGLGDYGLGLYQKSNYLAPQRIQNGRLPSSGSSMFTWGDGSQTGMLSTVASAGSDSTAAC